MHGHNPSVWEVGAWGNLVFKASLYRPLGYIVSCGQSEPHESVK